MDTAWLEVFRAIARTGSFTAAAKDLGYTQSAISRQVAALESEMGTELFHRLARGARLTEPGRYLLAHAEAVLARLAEAKSDIGDLRRLAAGRVRVGSFATVGVSLVPQAIARFQSSHPDVLLTHIDGFTRDLAPQVVHDELDVAVLNGYPPQIAALPPLRLRKLCDEPMFVAIPAGHRLARRRRVRLPELAGEAWIAGRSTPEETLISAALRQGFSPRIAYVVREWTAKQGFVAAGLGVTLVPALAAASVRPDVALVPVDATSTPVRGIYAATAAEVEPPPAVARFVDVLCEQTAELVTEINIQIPKSDHLRFSRNYTQGNGVLRTTHETLTALRSGGHDGDHRGTHHGRDLRRHPGGGRGIRTFRTFQREPVRRCHNGGKLPARL